MLVISDTRAIVRVFKMLTIVQVSDNRVCFGTVDFDVDRKLSSRGSDFSVFANTGYEKDPKDSVLLAIILNNLLTSSSGVERIDIKPFSLKILQSRAVTVSGTVTRILEGASHAGYKTSYRGLYRSGV